VKNGATTRVRDTAERSDGNSTAASLRANAYIDRVTSCVDSWVATEAVLGTALEEFAELVVTAPEVAVAATPAE
jgi:hypothetical protein